MLRNESRIKPVTTALDTVQYEHRNTQAVPHFEVVVVTDINYFDDSFAGNYRPKLSQHLVAKMTVRPAV
jgi:hypothetical protein